MAKQPSRGAKSTGSRRPSGGAKRTSTTRSADKPTARRNASATPRPRPNGDRPSRPRSDGDRPSRPRSFGDRPAKPRSFGDRPAKPRSFGDRSAKPRSFGDRPSRPRTDGDRPSKPRSFGDRPARPRFDSDRSTGERRSARPMGDRRSPRPTGDRRPARPLGERRPRRAEDARPRMSRPRTEGEAPTQLKLRSGEERATKPSTSKPSTSKPSTSKPRTTKPDIKPTRRTASSSEEKRPRKTLEMPGSASPKRGTTRRAVSGTRTTRPTRGPVVRRSAGAPKDGSKIAKRTRPEAAPQKSESTPSDTIRLNRFIASAGITSRRKADELIEQGAVTVNGKVIKELGVQVKPYADHVTVNGATISLRPRYLYLLLNKPKDTITTTNDEKERTTVLDYVQTHERVYPVGRLDRNTTGVLLLTNDGDLTNRLTHPSYQIDREYQVTLDKGLTKDDAQKIAEGGLDLGEGDITGPAEVSYSDKDPRDVLLRLREGKNREVRRIFEKLGYDVEKLDRISFAGITHRGLARGGSRSLTPKEVRALRQIVGLDEE